METVQLQCGNCRQVMAIGVEHLGSQVQCPHCQSVVQTPPRAPDPAPAPPAAPPLPNMELQQRESIFTGAEASDAVMGGDPAPKVELPPSPQEAFADASGPSASPEFAQFKTRPVYSSGVFQLIALIFLIPYAIVMTAFVIYLVLTQGARHDPYEFLRDPAPNPKSGAPRTVKQPVHTLPLAAHLKTTLGKPIQIGDLLVTFERVRLSEDGELRLSLRAKNVSTNTVFEPMNEAYVNAKGGELYTHLESKSKNLNRVYGAYLEYYKNLDGAGEPVDRAVLQPSAQTLILLKTEPHHKKQVAEIARATDSYTWRVQVRRGFVKVDGKNVSATAVIGVEFSSAEIEREGKKT